MTLELMQKLFRLATLDWVPPRIASDILTDSFRVLESLDRGKDGKSFALWLKRKAWIFMDK